ncbi:MULTISPECIES: peptidoglycan-binding domain-containing protein [Actinomycetes]|uniref:Peptidoglycan binding-like domain-containing protein n=3 Tax=Actinomycetes TaxID=1760 RepID=A0ABN3M8C2_9ACTN|nr:MULTISPECIES: peptidoglycan-binding domain-containing protein [Streptomyces]MYQ99840.1 hypothetical protein [Streptomyces sp. SID6139]WDO04241.1 peptidoglycan-binding protein [Streptomyces murinus]
MRTHTWTRRAAALTLGAAAALALTVGSANAAGNLATGSSGPAVVCLQRALDDVDGAGLGQDGQFGTLTRNAVVHFQSEHGLSADGVVGPNTGATVKNAVSQAYYAAHRANDPSQVELGNWTSTCSSQLPG